MTNKPATAKRKTKRKLNVKKRKISTRKASPRNFFIYIFTFPNGKRYVGKTNDVEGRWKGHKKAAERLAKLKARIERGETLSEKENEFFNRMDLPVYRAIIKYGWENIKKEYFSGYTEKGAFAKERFLIKKLKTHVTKGKRGYNLTDGGEGTSGMVHSQATRKKISKSHLGKKQTQETRDKISATQSAKRNACLKSAMQMLAKGVPQWKVAEKHGVTRGAIRNWIEVWRRSLSKKEAAKFDAVMKANGKGNVSKIKHRDARIEPAMQMLIEGMLQEEVAKKSGVHRRTLYKWIKIWKQSVSKKEAAKLDAAMAANQRNGTAAKRDFRDANLKSAMRMLDEGYTYQEVGDYFGKSGNTISRWKREYEQAA